jgi:hypothetical protein
MMPLHMIWLGDGLDNQKIVDARQHCDDVRLYTDDSELMPQWREAYDTCTSTIQSKSDLLRLSVLRKYGGLYIDFDVSIFAAPEVITEGWDNLSVCSLGESFILGGDVIYCPLDWPNWSLVDSLINASVAAKKRNQMQFGNDLFLPLFFEHRALSPIMLGAEMVKNGVTVMRRFNAGPQMAMASMPAVPAAPAVPGPGAHLASLLGRLRLSETPGCKCRSYSAQMDRWGVDGCTDRILEIVAMLRAEAGNRGLPFVDFAGKLLVNRAIANARRSAADAKKTAAAQGHHG